MSIIATLRKARGWTQQELADKANISRTALAMIETSPGRVGSWETRCAIADVLGVALDVLREPDGHLELARALLTQAAASLDCVEGKAGLAGSVRALLGRFDEPPPLPSRPPDLWTDVRRSVAGLHAVCLANGIPAERAHQFVDAHAAVLADCIEGLAEEVRGG